MEKVCVIFHRYYPNYLGCPVVTACFVEADRYDEQTLICIDPDSGSPLALPPGTVTFPADRLNTPVTCRDVEQSAGAD